MGEDVGCPTRNPPTLLPPEMKPSSSHLLLKFVYLTLDLLNVGVAKFLFHIDLVNFQLRLLHF